MTQTKTAAILRRSFYIRFVLQGFYHAMPVRFPQHQSLMTIVRAAALLGVALLSLSINGPVYAADATQTAAEKDRWEGFNRGVFAFNEFVDRYALKPAAKGYKWVTPTWLDNTVTRFFENMRDFRSGVNNVLQWEWYNAGQNFGRFTVNSTMGVAGVFDLATDLKLRKYPDDLGSTFAVWGMGEGPYIMLPFLGPSMGRDALALWPEDYMRLRHYIDHDLTRYSVTALYALDVRADILEFENSIVGDRYSFIRDFYFQSRRLQAGEDIAPDDFGADADSGGWDDAPSDAGFDADSPEDDDW